MAITKTKQSWRNLESEWFKTDAAKALDACGAPELLEALKKTADMLGSACHFVPKNGGLMQMLAVVDVARAAIAKAEGGAA